MGETGEIYVRVETFLMQGNSTVSRVLVAGTADQTAKLPTSDDPSGVLGIAQTGYPSGRQEAVATEGRYLCEAGGQCTFGGHARVLNHGKVSDPTTNATPTLQQCVGYFRSSGVNGDLVSVEIEPHQAYQ